MQRTLRITLLALLVTASFATFSAAQSYRYIAAETLLHRLKEGKPPLLLDLSPETLFALKHIPGSIPTGAYPLKTPAQRARLDAVLPQLAAVTEEIVLICPRGGQTALRAVGHLQAKGVDATRLLILQNGILGWPYPAARNDSSDTQP